ncbi:MAG: xanthine dehydrogenase family protein subunit M [Clostridiales bacterium]
MIESKGYEYYRPGSWAELAAILCKTEERVLFLAGGTDLFVDLRSGKKSCAHLVDLKGLKELKGIEEAAGEHGERELRIGALTAIHQLETYPLLQEKAGALPEAACQLGSRQVRNRATLGGNLANASPTADTAAPLLALDAVLELWSPAGERRIPVEELWQKAGKTFLAPDEIIRQIIIPLVPRQASAFMKLGPRQAMDIAIISAAASLSLEEGRISQVRIALGGAGEKPLRMKAAEEYLLGKEGTAEHFAAAGRLAARESSPRSSRRASREYRLATIPVLTERVLLQALSRLS